jgi:hypothetical protein
MIEVPFESMLDATRLRMWWPWIALALGVAIIAVGGALFTAA